MEKLKVFCAENRIKFECDVNLKRKTWIKTGGIAKLWIIPTVIDDLILLCRYLYRANLKFELVGHTSNLFFREEYNPNIVVSTIKLNNYEIKDNSAICDCGVHVSSISKEFVELGYIGYYGLVDLPGTVAAAVYNNSSCYNCSVGSLLRYIDVLNENGEIVTMTDRDISFGHHYSNLKQEQRKCVIVRVVLKLEKSNENEVCKANNAHLIRKTQYEGPRLNLGSVYSGMKLRSNIKNLTIRIISRVFMLNSRQRKRFVLFLYGYQHLDKYISDKSLNTFIWIDDKAERLFDDYEKFINKVYRDTIREIEIKI